MWRWLARVVIAGALCAGLGAAGLYCYRVTWHSGFEHGWKSVVLAERGYAVPTAVLHYCKDGSVRVCEAYIAGRVKFGVEAEQHAREASRK